MDSQAAQQRVVTSADDISSERLKKLFTYWRALKGERLAPVRSKLNPAAMKEQLGWIWLMDVLEGGEDFRFRMGGDRVIQFFGQHLSGERLTTVQPQAPAFFGRFLEVVKFATEQKLPVIAGPSQAAYEPRAYLEVEVLILPLSDDGTTVNCLLGSIEIRPLAKALEPRDV